MHKRCAKNKNKYNYICFYYKKIEINKYML